MKVYYVRGSCLYVAGWCKARDVDVEERLGEGEWRETKLVHRGGDIYLYTAVEVLKARAGGSAKFRLWYHSGKARQAVCRRREPLRGRQSWLRCPHLRTVERRHDEDLESRGGPTRRRRGGKSMHFYSPLSTRECGEWRRGPYVEKRVQHVCAERDILEAMRGAAVKATGRLLVAEPN